MSVTFLGKGTVARFAVDAKSPPLSNTIKTAKRSKASVTRGDERRTEDAAGTGAEEATDEAGNGTRIYDIQDTAKTEKPLRPIYGAEGLFWSTSRRRRAEAGPLRGRV